MSRFPPGLRYMAVGAFFFSVMSALVKEVGTRIPTMEVVLARSVVVLVLSAWTLAAGGRPLLGRERGVLVVRGVLGFVALTCFYYGLIHLPLADATVIQYTNPVFTALLAVPVLGEALRPVEVALAVVGLAGVLVVARPSFLFGAAAPALDPVAVAVALGGALFSAAAYVTVRRLRREDPLVVVLYFAAVSVVGALPAVVPVFVLPRGREWALLLGVGVATHLGQVFLTRGLQRERAGRATAVGYLQIVFAALWGATFFGEVPGRWTVGGAVLIVTSTWLLARTSVGGGRPAPGGSGPAADSGDPATS